MSSTAPTMKMMRSRSRREKMSNERSPRADCSMTIGTSLLCVVVDGVAHGLAFPRKSVGGRLDRKIGARRRCEKGPASPP